MKNRIEELRRLKHVNQKELGDAIGVAQTTISTWERGTRQPDHECLILLADFFNVSTDYILGRSEHDLQPTQLTRSVVTINVYGTIPAGVPVEAIEDIISTEQIPAEWIAGGREYFALQVKGDSMWPVYLDGDIVIVRKQSACRTGDDCVVYVNGYDATLKRVKLHEDGGLEIVPLNVNYPPRTFTREEVGTMPITIGGDVVELRRKIK